MPMLTVITVLMLFKGVATVEAENNWATEDKTVSINFHTSNSMKNGKIIAGADQPVSARSAPEF